MGAGYEPCSRSPTSRQRFTARSRNWLVVFTAPTRRLGCYSRDAGRYQVFQTFISVPAGDIPAAYSYAADAPLADKLVSEIGAAVEAANGAGTDMQGLLSGTLDDQKSPVLQVMYHRLANSSVREACETQDICPGRQQLVARIWRMGELWLGPL
jgi:hypothetical protein